MPGKGAGQSGGMKGMAITILIGIAGAAVGGFLCNPLFGWDVSGFNLQSLLVAVAGALVLLFVYRLVVTAARTS
jgi:uncharacterized membrane protein YeaQ/YmgE (transglycosylase-associated protein family)